MYREYDPIDGEFYYTEERFALDDHFYADSPAGLCQCGAPKRTNEVAMVDRANEGNLIFLRHTYCRKCDAA